MIVASGPNIPEGNDINLKFNDMCRLVELKLMVDISEDSQEGGAMRVVRDILDIGGDAIAVHLSKMGQYMFEKHGHDKWRN